MQLANEFKILVDKSPLVEFYVEQQKRLSEICKRAKYDCDLDLVLENKDFFIESNENHFALRKFIFEKIRTGLDFYKVDDFKDDFLDKKIDNLKEARQNLKRCSEILQEYDMRFFMSDEESTIYLTTADKLLDKTVILLKQIIN